MHEESDRMRVGVYGEVRMPSRTNLGGIYIYVDQACAHRGKSLGFSLSSQDVTSRSTTVRSVCVMRKDHRFSPGAWLGSIGTPRQQLFVIIKN